MDILQQTKNTDIYSDIETCSNKEERKKLLIQISNNIKPLVAKGLYLNINEGIIDLFKNNKHQEFKTFKEWKSLGFSVLKGSKAFFVWSKPKTGKKEKEKPEDSDEYKFFGIAYIFSNAQVKRKDDE